MKKGFTLIELLVSMTIFSIVMVSVINLFSAGIETQRKTLALQTLSNSTSYVIEYMSRSIRMAKKDLGGIYIDAGCNFKPSDSEESYIRFLNYDGKQQEFKLDNEQIKEKKELASEPTALTSDNFKVNKLVFRVSGGCQDDELQPKVTIVIEIQTKETKPQILNLQTTISQRDLDVKY
jgi:prepilin-type N-terminal cleavage/methylation domain-containing protein